MRREEERIRAKTAQALSMKAQWKQAQIETSMNKALEGMSADGTDQAFERAAAKISNARSEGQARTELARESLSGKLAGLDDVQASNAADAELAQMEQRLGLAPAPQALSTVSRPNPGGSPPDIDRQLQELEARVGGSGGSSAT